MSVAVEVPGANIEGCHTGVVTDIDDQPSSHTPHFAIGAAVGLAVIATTYDAVGYRDRQWVAAVVLAIALALVHVLPEVRRLFSFPGLAPASLLLVLIGLYLCVPETNQIRIAAMFPVAVIVLEVVGRRQVGLEWYGVAAAAVFWAGMLGTAGRPSAIVGALFAWWAICLLGVVSVVVGVVRRSRPIRSTPAATLAVLIGTASAWGVARTGGLVEKGTREPMATAVGAAVVSFALALAIVWVFDRPGTGGEPGTAGVSARP